MILSGGGDSDLYDAAEDVPVQAGLYGDVTDMNGDFTIPPQLLVGETTLRYLVTYNGSSRIQEAKLPNPRARKTSLSGYDPWSGEWKTVDAIDVLGQYPEIPSWAVNGVRFTGVEVYQDSLVSDVISALEMTGKKVQVSVYVSDEQPYAFDNETLFEHVRDVTFFFRNPITQMIHGQWSLSDGKITYNESTGAYTLTIDKFTPDAPNLYTAGDVLYVQLTTDKKFSFDPKLQDVDMVYAPISTGVSVFTADDFEPETFDFNMTDFKAFLQTGSGGDTHASFGQFPWMGQITIAIRSFNFLRKMSGDATAAMIMEDLDEQGGGGFGGYRPEDDGLIPPSENSEGNMGKNAGDPRLKGIGFSMFIDVGYNSYGAVRFKLAAVASKGVKGHYERMIDPYRSWQNMSGLKDFVSSVDNGGSAGYANVEGIKWDYSGEAQKMNRSEYLGGYLTFALYVGFYLDYGYIYIETYTPGSDTPETTTDMVFMGAGGFVGTRINAGYTGIIPAFPLVNYNFEAQGDVALYFGKGADPTKTLEAFENSSHHSGQDFGFTFEFKGRVQVSASFGIGVYKIIGVRIGAAFGMDFGFSNQMAEWLPQIGTGWGLTTDITFFGEFNLFFFTIPLWSYSWPLPLNAGWGEYMQEIQRGQRCIQVVEKQIKNGKGSDEARAHTLDLIKQYWDFVDARLGNDPDRDRLQAGKLMWTVYDADDNLYVVWTDTTLDKVHNEALDEDVSKTSVEIYATARIREADVAETKGSGTAQPVRWSKPYRLTRDNMYHDGLAIALADDGGLIIVHNQYDMLLADTQEEQEKMVLEGRAGWKEVDGETYLVGSPYYPSESDLMITRCAPVGSLEATIFEYSDNSPMPGDEITVKAVVENVGLTAAYGCDVDFYAVKDGRKVGGPVHSIHSDETILVNTAKETAFKWTVPAEGADGYGFMAVISEKKADGSFYEEPVESFSDPFRTVPQYEITVDRFEQNGDAFDVEYTVKNTGNAPAPEGMRADLYLKALYGDLEDDYGMDDDLLIEEDISGLAAGETRVVKRSVTLPATVFRLCGYDAVQAIVEDERDQPYESTDQFFINMKTPMNLSLNDGNPVTVTAGETIDLPADYDSNAFIRDTETVLYTVDDPSVAMVDKDGNVTGISSGTTTLTATMLSSGKSVSIPVTVEGGYLRGDVNDDGKVNSDDAIYLLRNTMSPERYPINQSGDMNGDGKVNSNDAIYLLRHTMSPARYPLAD